MLSYENVLIFKGNKFLSQMTVLVEEPFLPMFVNDEWHEEIAGNNNYDCDKDDNCLQCSEHYHGSFGLLDVSL